MSKVVPLVILLLFAGCRHVTEPEAAGRSSFVLIEPPPARPGPVPGSAETTEPTSRAQYREASIQEKSVVLPIYPPRALAARFGAAAVAVRVTVDVNGRVADIRPSLLSMTTRGPFADEFREAVEAALRQWRFHPAKAEHIETVTERGFTYHRVTRTETLEAEFDLAFTFTTTGGVETEVR